MVIGNNFQFDYNSGTISIENNKVELTQKETKFLKLLFENSIVTYDMMYQYLWDYEKMPTQDAVKSFIRKLQKKLPNDLCKNKKGIGYYLSNSK